MASMFCNSHLIQWSAQHAAKMAKEFNNPESYRCASYVLSAVVMSVASAEAFINELGDWLSQITRDDPKVDDATLRSVGQSLKLLEDDQGKLSVKYLVASHLLGAPFDRGTNPFQDFQELVKVRNAIIHFKTLDTIVAAPDGAPRNKLPKLVVNLQDRGLARKLPEGMFGSWFPLLFTPELAAWACGSSLAIVRAVLALIKDAGAKMPFDLFIKDPFDGERT